HRSSVLPLFFLLLRRRPPCPPFFPYTTLFRSRGVSLAPCWHQILCIGASGLRFNAISEASETRFSDFGCAVLRWTAELIIRDAGNSWRSCRRTRLFKLRKGQAWPPIPSWP